MSGKAGRGADQFVVRLPDGMRQLIKDAADASGRSMNAEIVQRLEATFMHESLDQWHEVQLARRNEALAEQRRDVAGLSQLADELADQIAEKILSELGQDRPPLRPVGAIKVTTRKE